MESPDLAMLKYGITQISYIVLSLRTKDLRFF